MADLRDAYTEALRTIAAQIWTEVAMRDVAGNPEDIAATEKTKVDSLVTGMKDAIGTWATANSYDLTR